MGRQRTGRQGRFQAHRHPSGDGGPADPRRRSQENPPAAHPVQQAPAAAQAVYRGYPRPPYQGQRPYQGRGYHPYQRGSGDTRGRGRGRGRGHELFQAQTPNLPPVVAAPNRPEGNPPNEVHFADEPYGQAPFLPEPLLERWVTGYSHDSHPPMDANATEEYDYAPEHSYEDNNYQGYEYYGDEDEE